MRILFCNYEYPPLGGGGGVVNAMLAEELAKRHDVAVLTSRAFELAARSDVNGVRVIRVPVFFRTERSAANFPSMLAYLPMGVTAGLRLLRDDGYDVINTHFVVPSGPVGDALARRSGLPNVVSVHGGDLYDPSKWSSPHRHRLLRTYIRRLLRRADLVVGQSRNTLDNMRRYFTPEIEGLRIPLGIQRPPSSTASRDDYGYTTEDVLLVTVGRLVARKAVEQLISLVRDLEDPRTHLLIIGTGPLENSLRRQAEEQGVAERIRLLGGLSETEKFGVLRMSDIFVSSSQHEGFGLVFLEAMACGLPVVSYDHGGQTDFLQDDHSGHLLPLNDQQALRDRCRQLIADAAARARMGRENLGRVEELFIDRCAERYEEAFERAIAEHPRRGHGE